MNTKLNTKLNTPTPRTDAAFAEWQEGWDRTEFGPDFARTLERELAREREKVRVLRAELTNIAAAKPAHWGDEMDQFMPWAQSRARHTLAATEEIK